MFSDHLVGENEVHHTDEAEQEPVVIETRIK